MLYEQLRSLLEEYQQQANLTTGHIFVVGCSTSEIIGNKIGTAGTLEVVPDVYRALYDYATQYGLYLAFQCCEHLNRAIVISKECQEKYNLEAVSVRPVREAGGAMPEYVFNQTDAIVVEEVEAHGGIDIGDTFIGMHLKRVAVPVRVSNNKLGQAHVTFARTRPKLIGGARAKYI